MKSSLLLQKKELKNPVICSGCDSILAKGAQYVKIGDAIICDYCVDNNWNEVE